MFDIFKKKDFRIVSPICGKCIDISEVPDPVFSEKMLGDGFAVIPDGNMVVCPADGEITMIAETKHAVGIKTKDDKEILIHIGLNTVKLKGKGFECMVKEGKKVKAGEPIVRIDYDEINKQEINLTTMVIFTQGYDKEVKLNCYGKEVKAGEAVIF